MAAAIAHEVKNPLAGIEVMAGILKRQLPSLRTRSRSFATSSRKPRWRMPSSSRCSTSCGRSGCRSSASRLSDVVRDAISMAESHVPRGDVRVEVVLPEDLAPIQGDPHQLRQLFTNLFTNAFEAMTGKGHVRLAAQQLAAEEEPTAGSRHARRADDSGGGRRQRPGRAGRRDGPDFQPVLHDQAAGLRAGSGHRPKNRRRARRAHRRERAVPKGARASGSRCRSAAATSCFRLGSRVRRLSFRVGSRPVGRLGDREDGAGASVWVAFW